MDRLNSMAQFTPTIYHAIAIADFSMELKEIVVEIAKMNAQSIFEPNGNLNGNSVINRSCE